MTCARLPAWLFSCFEGGFFEADSKCLKVDSKWLKPDSKMKKVDSKSRNRTVKCSKSKVKRKGHKNVIISCQFLQEKEGEQEKKFPKRRE